MLPLFTGIPAHFPHPEKNEIVLWFFHTLHRKKGLNNDFTPNTIPPAYHRKASEFPPCLNACACNNFTSDIPQVYRVSRACILISENFK